MKVTELAWGDQWHNFCDHGACIPKFHNKTEFFYQLIITGLQEYYLVPWLRVVTIELYKILMMVYQI